MTINLMELCIFRTSRVVVQSPEAASLARTCQPKGRSVVVFMAGLMVSARQRVTKTPGNMAADHAQQSRTESTSTECYAKPESHKAATRNSLRATIGRAA
jgi:hypothetical protein